ncbi:hypothetical protein F4553_000651 [Allocatelliglobosispora scoriae]|uniref:Uncharacterized protein n=1 Tax=Allocatelliglobosispora scoriae TaxID=643052 RepID=A0A841BKJ3_9ACTN|nr:hypothetical protein [Allocatelliglobosispora scoriae]MBB5867272.1 hypothetical protein [Allocatelliglobosispora scoriae]
MSDTVLLDGASVPLAVQVMVAVFVPEQVAHDAVAAVKVAPPPPTVFVATN